MAYTFPGDINDVAVYANISIPVATRTGGTVPATPAGTAPAYQPQFHKGISIASPIIGGYPVGE